MPGGDAIVASNYVYMAKPDGLMTLFTSASVHLNQILGLKAVKYDVSKMPAALGQSNSNVYVAKAGLISKPEDIARELPAGKKIIFGHTMGGAAPIGFVLLRELIGFPSVDKVIMGYGGAGDAFRALVSGELNMSAVSGPMYYTSVMPLLKAGDLVLLFQNGILDEKGSLIRDPVFSPDVPTGLELYEKVHGKPAPPGVRVDAYLAIIAGGASLGKALLLPPGAPDSIAAIYRSAADKLLANREFLEMADQTMGQATWYRGEVTEKVFKEKFTVTPQVRDWLRDLLTGYGVAID